MRNRSTRTLAALLLGLAATPLHAQAPLPSTAERAYVASRLYSAMQLFFAHWDDAADVDLDAAYRGYLEQALAARDRTEFTLASQAFLATFRNGHTLFVDRELVTTEVGRPVGFRLRRVEGRWAVTASAVAGLRPGDVVTALDGEPIEEFFRGRRRFIAASTEQWAERVPFEYVPGFFSGGMLFPVRFTLTLADGRRVAVDRAGTEFPALPATEGRWIEEGRTAYIRVPSFSQPAYEAAAVELVKRFAGARTLVVDVRGNTGGSTPVDLQGILMDRPYRWWAESTPMTVALLRFRAEEGNWNFDSFRRPHLAWPSTTSQPREEHFRGRVILLVDGGCNSACEDFVMPFKDNGRATIVGETTAGSTGQPYMADLGNGLMVVVGAKREFFPGGGAFESVGIRPDVELAPRIAELRTGRDGVLERALAMARGR